MRSCSISLIAVILMILFIVWAGAQTVYHPAPSTQINNLSQIKTTITAVEWAKCDWSSTDGKSSCRGLELFRFKLLDGTIVGPFVAVKMDSSFVKDPAKWTQIPIR